MLNPSHAQHIYAVYAPVPSRKTPPAPPLLAVTGERAPGRKEIAPDLPISDFEI